MSKKKRSSAKSKKQKDKGETPEKSQSLTGCTSANFHEAGRSEYLAHYVFSSFGTSVPVPRQEDTGLDLLCSLCERDGQRIWPIASYSVQVKSDDKPWIFAATKSIKWVIEHPLPIFFCVVDKKSATLRIYHTSPRFHLWVEGSHFDRVEMTLGDGTKGFGHPWGETLENEETPVIPSDCKYSLSAPIAKFSINEILDTDFHIKIKKILYKWVESDRRNIFRIQAGTRSFETFSKYETNNPEYTTITRYSRNELRDEEQEAFRRSFIEQAKSLSKGFAAKKDWLGMIYVDLLQRHLDALNYIEDGGHGYHLYSELRKHFEPGLDSNSKFFGGLDGLREKIAELSQVAIDFADQNATQLDNILIDPAKNEES